MRRLGSPLAAQRIVTAKTVVLALLLIPLLGVTAAAEQSPSTVGVSVQRTGEGFVVVLHSSGEPLLRLAGVAVTTPSRRGPPEHVQRPFERLRRQGGAWVLETADRYDHGFRLILSPMPSGALAVRLVDEVGIHSSVVAISLDYEWLGRDPPDFVHLPFRTPEPSDVAPDIACATPVLVASRAPRAAGLLPELRTVRGQRRLPWFLQWDGSRRAIVHGIGRAEVRAGRYFQRRGAAPIEVGEERIQLAHEIHVGHGREPSEFLNELCDLVWDRSEPAARTLDDHTLRELCVAAIHESAAWVEDLASSRGLARLAEVDAAAGTPLLENHERRPLAIARSVFEYARADGDRTLQEHARKVARLFAESPGISNLFSTRAAIRGGRVHWQLDDKGCYRTAECAIVGLRLLAWSDTDPRMRDACLERVHGLADALVRHRKGKMFAARLERDVTEPRSVPTNVSAGTLTCARFLLAMWRRTQDSDYLDAARKAYAATAEGTRPSAWLDLEAIDALRGTGYDGMLSARSVIEGALLAFELAAATSDRALLDDALRWTRRLSTLQQSWSPLFFTPRLRGGIFRANYECVWSDVTAIEAASVFGLAWRATGSGRYLRRAAAVLDATGRTGGRGWGRLGVDRAVPVATPTGGFAAAAPALLSFLDTYGDVIVDSRSWTPIELERSRVSAFERDSTRLLMRLSAAPAAATGPPLRVRIDPVPASSMRIVCNDVDQGVVVPARLGAGLTLPPEPDLSVRFAPPPRHQRGQDLELRAWVRGALDPNRVAATVTVRDDVGLDLELPVASTAGHADVRLSVTIPAGQIRNSETLHVRLGVTDGPRRASVPVAGDARIELGRWSLADCGDDDERHLTLAGRSRVVPDAGGDGRARRVEDGDSMAYSLPIPASALRARLRVRYAGRVLLRVDRELEIELDAAPAGRPREADLVLTERRFWNLDRLLVELRARGAAATVSRIEYSTSGNGTPANRLGREIRPARRLERFDLHVVPLQTERAARHDTEALRLLFFGGPELAVVPPPTSRATSGSLASRVRRLSRGRASVQGSVGPWRPSARASPITMQEAARIARAHLGAGAATADLVYVLHTGGVHPPAGIVRATPAAPACAVVDVAAAGGALVSGSELTRLLLLASTELPAGTSPAIGALGPWILTGAEPASDDSPAPLGLRLHELGWVAVHEAAAGEPEVRLPAVARDGYVLSLPHHSDDRGGAFVEQRTLSGEATPLRVPSLLAYWDFGRAHHVLAIDPPAGTLRPRLLPIDDDGGARPLPPGRAPWVRSAGLELRTPYGERCWRIANPVRLPDGSVQMDVGSLGVDLLAQPPRATSRAPSSRDFVPVALNGGDTSTGSVRSDASRLVARTPRGRGGMLRLTWDAVGGPTGARVFGRARGSGGRIRIGRSAGGRRVPLLSFGVSPQSEPWIVTLPAARTDTATNLFLELENDGDGQRRVELESLRIERLTAPVLELSELVRAEWIETEALVLSDGRRYGPALVLGRPRWQVLDVPVAIPRSGAVLRVQAGLAGDAAAPRDLVVEFRESRRGSVTKLIRTALRPGSDPLPLFLVDLAPLAGRTGFLEVRAPGAGPPVHLPILSLRER